MELSFVFESILKNSVAAHCVVASVLALSSIGYTLPRCGPQLLALHRLQKFLMML
ncbi:MAG: hypothetical protein K2W99_03980 [Chthoniobacterales bacterium]|nr:hypothetical protein [Chthoniobacterales bacterium]